MLAQPRAEPPRPGRPLQRWTNPAVTGPGLTACGPSRGGCGWPGAERACCCHPVTTGTVPQTAKRKLRVVVPARLVVVTVIVWRPVRSLESARRTRSEERRLRASRRPSSLTVVLPRVKLVTRTRNVVRDVRVQTRMGTPAITITAFVWKVRSEPDVVPPGIIGVVWRVQDTSGMARDLVGCER